MTHISRLTLTAFRNYAALRLDAGPQPIVLTGPNGAGKTNLLEAISLLGPGRGLRGARLSEISTISPLSLTGEGKFLLAVSSAEALAKAEGLEKLGEGANSVNEQSTLTRYANAKGISFATSPVKGEAKWAVAAAIDTQAGTREIGTGQEDSPDRRIVRIDGTNRAQGALAEIASILWITPAMDRLFAEGSSARRKFLDRIVYGYDPAHATRLNRYEQALRERQKLLELDCHPAWLDGIESVLAETGVAVAASRLAIAAKLNAACAEAKDASFPLPAISVSGEIETYLTQHSALMTEDWFRGQLAANRGLDASTGRCQAGVHRSDLTVRYAEKDMPAALCSTGEQKALLIALVLANAALLETARGDRPILLLDEITAHLDESRRAALFERIAALGLQAWMSGTEEAVFAPLGQDCLRLHVEGGTIALMI